MRHSYEFDQDTYDQAFEPFYRLRGEVIPAVMEAILPECDAAVPRKRKRRRLDNLRYRQTLALVVANALRASEHPKNKRVHYSRKAQSFTGRSLYHPHWLSHTHLKNAADALGAAEFLELTTGPNDQTRAHFVKLPQSTFQATSRLIERLNQIGVAVDDVFKSVQAPVVILKNEDKKLLDYDPHAPGIAKLIEGVQAYNRFIPTIALGLNISDDELAALHAQKTKDGQPRPPTNFKDIVLRRIFNNRTFDQGGRWNGGWWITIPSKYRDFILINGEPTVELDYSGFLTRAIYHNEGIDHQEDPYDIKPIFEAAEAQGVDRDSVRTSIKLLTNILINAGPRDKLGSISGLTLPKGFKRPNSVYSLIKDRHAPIAHRLLSGMGLRIMRRESDICGRILSDGIRNGIAVLPIHDSFVVQKRHEDWLCGVMASQYRTEFGFDCMIKKKEVAEVKETTGDSNVPLVGSQSMKPHTGESIKGPTNKPRAIPGDTYAAFVGTVCEAVGHDWQRESRRELNSGLWGAVRSACGRSND